MKVKIYLYAAIFLTASILTGCSTNEETVTKPKEKEEVKVLTVEQTKEVKTPLQLTENQKNEYYEQYKEIVEQANKTKMGIKLEVPPIADFEPEDWAEPKEYKQMVQQHIDSFLESERKALNALQATTTKAIMESDGKAKKTRYLYVSDIVFSVEVSGKFETQYNEAREGQIFAAADNITSHIASSSRGEWVQTSSASSLINNGQTYLIRIEGIHNYNGLSIEKAFSIEFDCERTGEII